MEHQRQPFQKIPIFFYKSIPLNIPLIKPKIPTSLHLHIVFFAQRVKIDTIHHWEAYEIIIVTIYMSLYNIFLGQVKFRRTMIVWPDRAAGHSYRHKHLLLLNWLLNLFTCVIILLYCDRICRAQTEKSFMENCFSLNCMDLMTVEGNFWRKLHFTPNFRTSDFWNFPSIRTFFWSPSFALILP